MDSITNQLICSLGMALALSFSVGCIEDSENIPVQDSDKADSLLEFVSLSRPFGLDSRKGFQCVYPGGCMILVTITPENPRLVSSLSGELVRVSVNDETKSVSAALKDGEEAPELVVPLDPSGSARFYLRARQGDHYLNFELPDEREEFEFMYEAKSYSLVRPCSNSRSPIPSN